MSEEKNLKKESAKEPKKEEGAVKKSQKKDSKKLAAIRIRGKVNLTYGLKKTFANINLFRQNWCVILDNTPNNIGMLKKLKDYITYGEIDAETEEHLYKEKGEEYKGRVSDSKNKIQYKKFNEYKGKKFKKYFRLNPPKGGFERKGIKAPFNNGGALGYRKEKISELIQKMI